MSLDKLSFMKEKFSSLPPDKAQEFLRLVSDIKESKNCEDSRKSFMSFVSTGAYCGVGNGVWSEGEEFVSR